MGKNGNQYIDHHHDQAKNQKPTKQKKKPMKITYISSPTMVKATDATEFRAIVQELTGKDSKVVGDFGDCDCTYSNKEANHIDHRCFPSSVEMEYDDSFTNVNDDGSMSPEIGQGGDLLWRDVSESFFGHQSSFVFV